jgi:hypothetical protein
MAHTSGKVQWASTILPTEHNKHMFTPFKHSYALVTTFDIGFDLGLEGFIGRWTFGSQRLQYWNVKN